MIQHNRTARTARWLIATAALTLGCSGSNGGMPPPEPRPLGAGYPTVVAPDDPGEESPAVPKEPAGDITLRDALGLALLGSPGLAGFAREIRAREAETLQADRAPLPGLGLELENVAGSGELSGFGGSETTVFLSQVIELGGKRGARRDAARFEQQLSAWDFEAARLDVLTEVTRAFASVLAAQDRVANSGDLVGVAERSLATVERRVRAGAVSPVESTRARVALAGSRLDLWTAERDLAIARRRLAALWGSTEPRFDRALGTLDAIEAPGPLAPHLLELDRNPDLARWMVEIERRRARVELERSAGAPDLTAAAGARYLAGSDDYAFILGLELPFPFADPNRDGRRAAEHRWARGRDEERSARVTAQTALAVAHATCLAAYREVTTLDGEILPEAATALETAQDAYERGLFRLTDVLDTQRTLFELRARRTDALEVYHHARARLERLIGGPLQESQP